jgi:hypothetical protein
MSANDWVGRIAFNDSTGETFGKIECAVDGTPGSSDYPGRLVFSTTGSGTSSPTEHLRIDRRGYLYASTDTTDTGRVGVTSSHVLHHNSGNSYGLVVEQSNDSTPQGVLVDFDDSSPDNNTQKFISCQDSTTERFRVFSDGDVQNHDNVYGAISDEKLKQSIVDASAQWDDLKNLRVRKFKFKSDVEAYGDEAKTLIGVVAQEVEAVSPGLVKENPDLDEEGNDLGTVTKSVNYSVLYMKAVKALQEAMERIEALEASNAALETRLTALEGGAS